MGWDKRAYHVGEPVIVWGTTYILLWLMVAKKQKKVCHAAHDNVFTMWLQLLLSLIVPHLDFLNWQISKPLPLNLKDSCSWSWWLHSVHLYSTKMSLSQASCSLLEKSHLPERSSQCWMEDFLPKKDLAIKPLHRQVLRGRACIVLLMASFAYSVLKANDICLSVNWE